MGIDQRKGGGGGRYGTQIRVMSSVSLGRWTTPGTLRDERLRDTKGQRASLSDVAGVSGCCGTEGVGRGAGRGTRGVGETRGRCVRRSEKDLSRVSPGGVKGGRRRREGWIRKLRELKRSRNEVTGEEYFSPVLRGA